MVILISRILRCSMRGLRLLWTRSSRILASRKRAVWRNGKLRKKIGSFAEDRSLAWSTIILESPVLMIQFFITLIYSQLLFVMMMFRNSTRDGMKFYWPWPRSHLMTSWKVCTNWEYASLRNSRPYWNCTMWRFIRRYRGWLSQFGKRWWKEAEIRKLR